MTGTTVDRSMPCLVPGCRKRVEACHTSWRDLVPLCREHHEEAGEHRTTQRHAFEVRHGVSLTLTAEELVRVHREAAERAHSRTDPRIDIDGRLLVYAYLPRSVACSADASDWTRAANAELQCRGLSSSDAVVVWVATATTIDDLAGHARLIRAAGHRVEWSQRAIALAHQDSQ
jgi:hypothetical protein